MMFWNHFFFLFFIAKNEASLRKVFDMDTVLETDVAVALTEHLLKALSPGQSCILDSKSKFKDPCKCGLKEKATFDKTLIGIEPWINVNAVSQ